MTSKISKMTDSNNESRLARTRDLITALYEVNSEVVVPSEGLPTVEQRDPHLRLRRTLTPPSKFKGMSSEEAQFMISSLESAGERTSLSFEVFGESFVCDGYFFGASEEVCTKRVFAVHGVTPGISRLRWHSLGESLTKEDPGIRFCAIDWHSLDRTDKPQDAFLTMLPKHFFDPVDDEIMSEMVSKMGEFLSAEKAAKWGNTLESIKLECPRDFSDAADVLRAMIEQGCGWGPGKPFALCVKSWSGGVGISMLLDDAKTRGGQFRSNISGLVLMHPGFLKIQGGKEAVEGIPTIMCHARDDPKVPFALFSQQYLDGGVKLCGAEKGGHANFEEFDNEAKEFLLAL